MKRHIASIIFVIGCLLGTAVTAGISGDDVRQKLVGVWEETRHLNCEIHHQQMTLSEDGLFVVRDSVTGCRNHTFVWRGTWSVANNKFRYTATSSESPDDVPVGEANEDEIISVSDTKWVMVEQSTGNRSVARRVKNP